jgi:hypothetical protein
MTPGGAELFLKCPVVFAPEYPDQIHGCGRMTGKPEDIPSRRESAPVHLIDEFFSTFLYHCVTDLTTGWVSSPVG